MAKTFHSYLIPTFSNFLISLITVFPYLDRKTHAMDLSNGNLSLTKKFVFPYLQLVFITLYIFNIYWTIENIKEPCEIFSANTTLEILYFSFRNGSILYQSRPNSTFQNTVVSFNKCPQRLWNFKTIRRGAY